MTKVFQFVAAAVIGLTLSAGSMAAKSKESDSSKEISIPKKPVSEKLGKEDKEQGSSHRPPHPGHGSGGNCKQQGAGISKC